MAGIQTKSFGLTRQVSQWEQLQLRRERSKALREEFEAKAADINAAFSSVGQSQIEGAGELAAKAALKRISAETEAKFQKADQEKSRNSIQVWKNKDPGTLIEAGDTKIDLTTNTITLSDGTYINYKTGKPPGNYLTLADGSKIDLDTGHKVIDIVT